MIGWCESCHRVRQLVRWRYLALAQNTMPIGTCHDCDEGGR